MKGQCGDHRDQLCLRARDDAGRPGGELAADRGHRDRCGRLHHHPGGGLQVQPLQQGPGLQGGGGAEADRG